MSMTSMLLTAPVAVKRKEDRRRNLDMEKKTREAFGGQSLTCAELAAKMKRSYKAVHDQLLRYEDRGLVRRVKSPHGRIQLWEWKSE